MWRRSVRLVLVVAVLSSLLGATVWAGTAAAADVTAPSAPTGVQGWAEGSGLRLSWSAATDDVGVVGYLVHRDQVFLAWVPGATTFLDAGVVAGRTYRYEVRAQDAAKNNSVPCAPVYLTLGEGAPDDGPFWDPPLEGLHGLIVTSWGDDATADGSPSRPYGSLGAAVRNAPAGTTIYLSNGIYREGVEVVGRRLEIRAVPGAEPVLSGADRVVQWTPSGGRWWAQSSGFPDYGWPTGMVSSARSGLVDIVVVDGRQLRQVTSVDQVGPDTFWVDSSERVWIGMDPIGHTVEIARRTRGLFVRDVDGFAVRGLTFRHYASGPGDMGALEIWGTGTVVSDVISHDNANAGIRLIGAWSTIENTRADHNGRVGATEHNVDNGVVRNSVFSGNNTEGFHQFGAAGGLKTTASRNVTIRGNTVNDNAGHGIWFDLSCVGIVVDDNTASGNSEAGILVEVAAQAQVTNNATSYNGRGLYIVESNDVWVTGNTTAFNERNVLVLDSYREGLGCVDREAGAIHVPPIDVRYGCQWPTVKWDIDNLHISGNIIVGGRPGSTEFAMLEINHVAHPWGDIDGEDRRRSAEEMNVTIGPNHFERAQAGVPRWVIGWSQWPAYMAAYESLSAFVAATGQGAGSTYSGP